MLCESSVSMTRMFMLSYLGTTGCPRESLCLLQLICVFNEEDLQLANRNSGSGVDVLSGIVERIGNLPDFEVMAYVVGFEAEFGYVGVRPCNGGLTRTY